MPQAKASRPAKASAADGGASTQARAAQAPSAPPAPPLHDWQTAWGQMGRWWEGAGQPWLQGAGQGMKLPDSLSLDPQKLAAIQTRFLQEAAAVWNQSLDTGAAPSAAAPLKDRRFADAAWQQHPLASFQARMYLLGARALSEMADSLEGDRKLKERVRFGVQQFVDAAAPSNFLALNPEAQAKALQSQGQSLVDGWQQLLHDLRQGKLSQTDDSQFEVGRNVATTPGDVVFENDYFQLIEYRPEGAQVREVPLLIVPPCINKFYILDLQPDNSLVRYALSQGQRVFLVSWRNPDESLAKSTWDDYIEHAVIEALRVSREVAGVPALNTLGFCVGGTMLATALAVLAGRGDQAAASLTLLTTFLDFSETGILDVFVDEAMVQLREASIGASSPAGGGLLKGQELAATFSFLRPNDLVWNYVVGNYLKGEKPAAFDLLYWNGDSTNLPGPFYCWYLRETYLNNRLKQPGALTVCGQPLDLGLIQAPVFVYASREDHIVPWESAYASVHLLRGPKTFVLGASGHIAGVINPASKNKRSHWVSGSPVRGRWPDAKAWQEAATEVPGSWWPKWAEFLDAHSGALRKAPLRAGSQSHPPIEPAPGRYVKVKA